MKMFMTVDDAAREIGYSPQTVRNRIGDGSIKAIQGAVRGAYRIPTMEVEAFKRRHGMATPIVTRVPTQVDDFDAADLFESELAPVMRRLEVPSPEDALRLLRESDEVAFSDFLSAYSIWVAAQPQVTVAR